MLPRFSAVFSPAMVRELEPLFKVDPCQRLRIAHVRRLEGRSQEEQIGRNIRTAQVYISTQKAAENVR